MEQLLGVTPPSHTARDLDIDLEAAGIPKHAPGGKLDFHACRVAYINFVIESGVTVKEAQVLARHATPEMTLNVYGRTQEERLSQAVEKVAENLTPSKNRATCVPRLAMGAEQESATPVETRGCASKRMVEAAGIEPASENGSTLTYYVRSRSFILVFCDSDRQDPQKTSSVSFAEFPRTKKFA